MSPVRMLFVASLTLGLVACGGGGGFQDLDQYMEEVKARPKGKIEPLPEFKAYQAFSYSAASRRSPFEAPQEVKQETREVVEVSNVQPDLNRAKELLESFQIADLKMVGTLRRAEDTTLWALVNDNLGGVHRVKSGQYMGKNHGRIIAIKEGQIDLIEIVPNGAGGWVERPRTLSLVEQGL